jgi:hypothetical protein
MDTFLVRTLLVPSAVVLIGRWNWWPSALSRARPAVTPAAPPDSGPSAVFTTVELLLKLPTEGRRGDTLDILPRLKARDSSYYAVWSSR